MKPQFHPVPQPDTFIVRLSSPAAVADMERDAALVRLMLVSDPAYAAWSEQRRIEHEAAYDAWLASPEGQCWLESEIAADEERRCVSAWEGW